MQTVLLFAAINLFRWIASKAGDSPTLVFVSAISLITIFVFGWAIIFHDHHPHRRHHHHHPDASATGLEQDEKRGLFSMLRGRKRRKRKKHRHANPTLAETGGLPETRDSEGRPPAPSA
jgi:hypothetical protein